MEKQWSKGLYPYKPVRKGDLLYGRGSVDDGYSFFLSVLIIKTLQKFKISHPPIVLIFETDEESGSKDILYHVKNHTDLIGKPKMLICLDAGGFDSNYLFITTSLKGILSFKLSVKVAENSVHSGDGGGLVPDSFKIGCDLIDQFEEINTGELPEIF